MKTKIICSLLLLEVVAGIAATNDPAFAPPLQITPALVNQYAAEMATNHPALLAASARTNAAAANIRSVRTWDDPMAKVGGMAADEMMRQEDGDLIYGLEQKLPLFGKPGAMRRMATAELAVAAATAGMKFQTLRSELAKSLFRAALADEAIAIAEQDLAWLDVNVKVVEESYSAG